MIKELYKILETLEDPKTGDEPAAELCLQLIIRLLNIKHEERKNAPKDL